MAEPFWTSTGDIREPYSPVKILTVFGVAETPAFGKLNPQVAMDQAVASLTAQAQKLGCNGVIWISFSTVLLGVVGLGIVASGTAVKVSSTQGQ